MLNDTKAQSLSIPYRKEQNISMSWIILSTKIITKKWILYELLADTVNWADGIYTLWCIGFYWISELDILIKSCFHIIESVVVDVYLFDGNPFYFIAQNICFLYTMLWCLVFSSKTYIYNRLWIMNRTSFIIVLKKCEHWTCDYATLKSANSSN